MTDAANSETAQAPPPPPFEPDLDLIDHLEGNEREIKRYRKHAEQMRDDDRKARSLGG